MGKAFRGSMATREQNEKRFERWNELPGGGRQYWIDLIRRSGWRVRYLKDVDAHETTVSFRQEIYDSSGALVEIHEKYPVDKGHGRV